MRRPPWLQVAVMQVRLQLRSPLWWGMVGLALVAVLFINPAAMIPTGGQAVGGVRPYSNSPLALAQSFALGGLLFHTFLATLLSGLAVIRDRETRVSDLLLSTPLGPAGYNLGTLAGILFSLGLVAVIHTILALLWVQLGPLVGGDSVLGPFRPGAYLAAGLACLLPGLLACGALGFLAAGLTRASLSVYACAALLLALGMAGLSPRSLSGILTPLQGLLDLSDIWGTRWLAEQVFIPGRSVEYYNQAALPPGGSRTGARLVPWLLVPLALLGGILGQLARRQGPRTLPWARLFGPGPVRENRELRGAVRPASETPDTGREGPEPGLWTVARESLRLELELVLFRPLAWLLLPLGGLLALDHGQSLRGVFDSRPLLTATGLGTGLAGLLTVLACLLLAWHQVEAAQRARRQGLAPMRDCRPVSPLGLLLGRQLAGLLLVLMPLAGAGAACAWMLAGQPGGTGGSILPLVMLWGGLLLPGLLFWSALVNALAVAFESRSAAWLAAFLGLAATAALFFTARLDWLRNWPLWGVFHGGEVAVFQADTGPLALNRGLVLLVALLLNLWILLRGRLRECWRLLVLPALALAGCALVLAVGMHRGYQGSEARLRDELYWTLNHDGPAALAVGRHPRALHLEAEVRIDPDRSRLEVRGFYRLQPRDSTPVADLAFTLMPVDEGPRYWVNGVPCDTEDRSGLFLLTPADPLPAGREIRVDFEYAGRVPRGWSRRGGPRSQFILPGGLALGMLEQPFLPLPGYQPERGRPDDEAGGTLRDTRAGPLAPVMGGHGRFTARITVDAPEGYTVNGVGHLAGREHRQGRTVSTWECRTPVSYLNLAGGPLELRQGEGVAVYYHPGHEANLEELVHTLEAARLWYSRWFLPCPWPELKLTELPALAASAQGYPGNIPFPEDLGFLTRSEGHTRLPAVVAAHEVAHQWWGNLLTPAQAPGADLLIEGAAHYSAARLLEELHGAAARDSFLLELERVWGRERRPESEGALLEMENHGLPAEETVFYNKGAWVLWMLELELGRPAMEEGLGRFFRHFAGEERPPRIRDLLETLRPLAADTASFDGFVQTWFARPSAPEFGWSGIRLDHTRGTWRLQAVLEQRGSGTVDPRVELRDGQGRPLGERTQVAGLAGGESRSLAWTLDRPPARLVVDPDRQILQLHRDRSVGVVPVHPAP
jgi:ABC-2 type transport system permease protein